MKKVAVLLAEGFEELEAITVIDVLRRAEFDVTVVSAAGSASVKSAHDVVLQSDCGIDELDSGGLDLVVLPGGMPGAKNLAGSEAVKALLNTVYEKGGLVAAICAAPIALHAAGLIEQRTVTSYPSFADKLGNVHYSEAPVAKDGRIITSRGPGTALAFAYALVEELGRAEKAEELKKAMLYQLDR